MCGTVGMFIGCAALTYCPMRLLTEAAEPVTRETRDDDVGGELYRSPFARWHERATVRQAPRRLLESDALTAALFPPELVPVAQHHLVAAMAPEAFQTILVQHLYQYLNFTAKLETLVVNTTILGIAQGTVRVDVPEEMAFDAYKMYCDEAYHALFSVDLARQVRRATLITPRVPEEPFFLQRLERLTADLPTHQRSLAQLLFVIISETLISASLLSVPGSDDVAGAVRDTIRDHAVDEGRHHAYFATFLRMLWDQLDARGRHEAALLTPALIETFLQPDLLAAREGLTSAGLGGPEADQVVAEVYDPKVVAEHSQSAARQTIRYFEELGAFDDAEARDALFEHGLAE
jgi:hypothetical protein